MVDKSKIIQAVKKAIDPLKPADAKTKEVDFLSANRTDAGRSLPPYYLVYFLLVDLLGFKNLGQFEKVAWSIPVDYEGKGFVIEHRKFGLGIFSSNLPEDEAQAEEIAKRIRKAVKIAQPYFDSLAEAAANTSKLNVANKSAELFARHKYFLDSYEAKVSEADTRKDERIVKKTGSVTTYSYPAMALRREAKWLALSTIETFFSWTEHIFIHIAILQGRITTGLEVSDLAKNDWKLKFQAALDITSPETKKYYDELQSVRQQLRNFDAHGSFGKNREAFQFHSSVGAVPLRLPYQQKSHEFRFGRGIDFVDRDAIELIKSFVDHLWSDGRAPAKIYIQDRGLPLILTHAVDGTYAQAMSSTDSMEEFVDYQTALHDRYADMDF